MELRAERMPEMPGMPEMPECIEVLVAYFVDRSTTDSVWFVHFRIYRPQSTF